MHGDKKKTQASSSFKMAISPSVCRVLIAFWGSDEIIQKPQIIVDLGADNVRRINRIGHKSLAQIAKALNSSGYIDSTRQWLGK